MPTPHSHCSTNDLLHRFNTGAGAPLSERARTRWTTRPITRPGRTGAYDLRVSAILLATAVATGAALGALLRWGLSELLNPRSAALPPGTLLANVIGGYGIGLALAWLAAHPELSPAWRLFLVTGFLGGLTTFSSFSAEGLALLQQGRLGWALAHTGAHVLASLAAAWAGMASHRWASG